MTLRAGMLHTVGALQGPLEQTAAALCADLHLEHRVDESLLARAIAGADTQALTEATRPHVESLLEAGAQAVLVSCSSLGEATDTLARNYAVPVVRIDRPMARRAVELGSRIAVLATLRSTLAPTTALVHSEAAARSAHVHVEPVLVAGAAEARTNGDSVAHDELIREAAHQYAADVDVVVLAQASMAEAFAKDSRELRVPVLTSPDLGVRAFVDMLREDQASSQSHGGPDR
jgi:glutamate racemase